MRRGVRMAVDVGTVRIGVAACDPDGLLATPVETVRRGPGDLARLHALAAEREPLEVLVGLPRSLSGNEGPAAALVREFEEFRVVIPEAEELDDSTMTVAGLLGHIYALHANALLELDDIVLAAKDIQGEEGFVFPVSVQSARAFIRESAVALTPETTGTERVLVLWPYE